MALEALPGILKPTDSTLEPAKITIGQEKVTFTSAFRYNATSKTYYREYNLSEPQFVGVPRPEIDNAWEELLAGTSNDPYIRTKLTPDSRPISCSK